MPAPGAPAVPAAPTGGVFELPVEQIQANKRQPRTVFADEPLDSLAASIKEVGVLQPVVVRRVGDGYELIAGERRLRAAKKAGLEKIPVILRKSDDAESLREALIGSELRLMSLLLLGVVGLGLGIFEAPNMSFIMGSIPRRQQGVGIPACQSGSRRPRIPEDVSRDRAARRKRESAATASVSATLDWRISARVSWCTRTASWPKGGHKSTCCVVRCVAAGGW